MQSWRLPSTQDRPEPLGCWSQAAALPWPPRAWPLYPDVQSHPHCLGPASQHRARGSPPGPAKATAQRPREQQEAGSSETFGKPLASVLVSCQSPFGPAWGVSGARGGESSRPSEGRSGRPPWGDLPPSLGARASSPGPGPVCGPAESETSCPGACGHQGAQIRDSELEGSRSRAEAAARPPTLQNLPETEQLHGGCPEQ